MLKGRLRRPAVIRRQPGPGRQVEFVDGAFEGMMGVSGCVDQVPAVHGFGSFADPAFDLVAPVVGPDGVNRPGVSGDSLV